MRIGPNGWVRVIVSGHADRLGRAAYNVPLSRDRAEAVRQVLIEEGLPAERIVVRAFGSAMPVTTICPSHMANLQALAECLQPDRRVEIEVR